MVVSLACAHLSVPFVMGLEVSHGAAADAAVAVSSHGRRPVLPEHLLGKKKNRGLLVTGLDRGPKGSSFNCAPLPWSELDQLTSVDLLHHAGCHTAFVPCNAKVNLSWAA